MATTKDDIRKTYPLPVYNFKVEIDGQTVSFAEVSGLTITHTTTSYAESAAAGGPPGPRWMYMPAQTTAPTITLRKGVVPAVSVAVFFNWIDSIQLNRVDKKDIAVRLCDEEGNAVVSWTVINAFPVSLIGPDFNASLSSVAFEAMTVMADRVQIEAA